MKGHFLPIWLLAGIPAILEMRETLGISSLFLQSRNIVREFGKHHSDLEKVRHLIGYRKKVVGVLHLYPDSVSMG